MNIRIRHRPITFHRPIAFRTVLLGGAVVVAAMGCAGTNSGSPAATATAGQPAAVEAPNAPSQDASPAATPATADATATTASSAEPDNGTTSGDVPDNAVFLDYRDPNIGFSIQYVEGWQVTPTTDGVAIRDKDSSELIQVGPAQADIPGYISSTDLPNLQTQKGFKLVTQDTVKVKGQSLAHLVYDIASPPDPVTGKQVPSTVDRYFVPGPNGLAIVSLATPKGVDNVDAFRQMIESFRWA